MNVQNTAEVQNQVSVNSHISRNTLQDTKDIEKDRIMTSEMLTKISRMFRIENLQSASHSKVDFEVRLWSTDGPEYPRCLMLSRKGTKWSARFISATESVDNKRAFKPLLRDLNNLHPKSNWSAIEMLFEEAHFRLPLELNQDIENLPPIPDEGEVILEIRQGELYDFASYRIFTSNPDGKKVLQACKSLEYQFDIKIGCKP